MSIIRQMFQPLAELREFSLQRWESYLDTGATFNNAVHISPSAAMTWAVVWGCVNVRAQDIAKVPLPLYRRLGMNGEDGREEATNHPVWWLLKVEPNPYMTPFVFRQCMQGHKDTAGNAYAWIERDKRGYPVALWPREPDWYRPEIVGGLLKYRYRLNGEIQYDDPQNVFHLKHLTRDGLVGMSPVEYFREGISLGLGYQSHAANTFRNAARPSLVASTPNVNLSPDKAKEIGKSLTDQYSGTSNAGKILVAYGGMELKPWGFSNKDAEYIESMRLSNEDACRIWRVPPYKVMDYTQSAYANMATASQEYVNDSLRPDQIMWEQEIASKLLGQRDRSVYYAEHNNEELLKGTPLERAQVENMRLMNGTSSIDEVRRSHNWKPVAGGDKHRTQMQMVPIDAVVEDQSEDTEPQSEPQARTVRKNVIRDERGNITAIEEVVI
jgi:HK97 family phage portal protein